jgi:hypothetical protein
MLKLKSAFVAIAILFNYCGSAAAEDKVVVSFPDKTNEPIGLTIIVYDITVKPPANTLSFKAKLPYTKVFNVSKAAFVSAGSFPKFTYKITRNGKPCMEATSMTNGKPDGYICPGSF